MPSHSALAIARPLYRTRLGTAHVGDSLGGMQVHLKDRSVQLFLTSPPFALRRKKEYGNEDASDYWSWFRPFAEVMWDKLTESVWAYARRGSSKMRPVAEAAHPGRCWNLEETSGRFRPSAR